MHPANYTYPLRRVLSFPLLAEAVGIGLFASVALVFAGPDPDPVRVGIGTLYACLGALAALRSVGAGGEARFADRVPAAVGWALWLAGFVTAMRWVGAWEETLASLILTWATFLLAGIILFLTPNRSLTETLTREPCMDGPDLATWRRWQWVPAMAILLLGFASEAQRDSGPDGLTLTAASFLALALMSSRDRLKLAPWRRLLHRGVLATLLGLAVILPEGGLWSLLQIGNSHPI
ncbi:hypothetical protein JANAI62_32200 [Jannaschia pagri]|uniref:Uncharacterized protein n=1 Tax=Jannaschia pagri TaxID=2829797 RepID=A0ABQ4NR94_9RHOB|nr:MULTISPECIES: hypothetical protein [unclassified Jannaschia]GIT92543.1 hypothetical protein JANAI61_30010 [Jannaschia sp. AI_61]GIT96597.1 hypothetical protein JANAI62_32200 [Jannaschia sp. AI_62]